MSVFGLRYPTGEGKLFMIDIHTLDLNFMGYSELIAVFLIPCPEGGFVLFETGPASTLETLELQVAEAGFEFEDLKGIFLTHVHLDHAAGAGSLAVSTGAPVFVHPEGAPHLIDPSEKLLPSAERLYKEKMIPLWGTVEPVPKELVVVVQDGDTVELDGLDIVAHHTPGHAVHHIAWQIGSAVVTGDIGGVRFPGASHVLPPMPPPDIDVDLWLHSLERIRAIEPEMLLLTHFGAFEDVERHLDELQGRLSRWLDIAERTLAANDDGPTAAEAILALDEVEMTESTVPPGAVERYRKLCPMDANAAGLERYCRRTG